jgi:guanylate kinase
MNDTRQGKLVVISAPSGTGKSTVCQKLRARCPEVGVSISHTTRKARGSERDGVEYHFVDDTTFDQMVARGDFLEWARVFDRRYGSSRAELERLLGSGKDVLFDIDVQGGRQIKAAQPEAILVFLLPPTIPELMRRLVGRGTESDEQIKKRLATAVWELEQGRDYDFHVVNKQVDETADLVDKIRTGSLPAQALCSELLEKLIVEARNLAAAVPGRIVS